MAKVNKKSEQARVQARVVDMSKFNQGDLFAIDAFDTDCLACGIGHDKAKFRFCMGEISHLRNEELRCLFTEGKNYVVVDLYLYGIKDVKIKFISNINIRYTEVVDFNEVDGRLRIRLLEDYGGIIEFQLGYESYKWEYVGEYTPDALTVEEEDRLAEETISGDEYKTIVWDE